MPKAEIKKKLHWPFYHFDGPTETESPVCEWRSYKAD